MKKPDPSGSSWRTHWKSDFVAALSVALVALPLSLGIATASEMSPASGILSALAGGWVTTFLRGSYVAINGPANSLIVVIAEGVGRLGEADQPASAWPYVAAAVVIAGVLQVLLGLLRVGNLARFVPPAVINGMLAGIGVMICLKQAHVAVGHHSQGSSGLHDLLALPDSLAQANPALALVSLGSLAILVLHPLMKIPTLHYIPGPLLVLFYAVPVVYGLDFSYNHSQFWWGHEVVMGPQYLVSVPDRLQDAILFPRFSKLAQPEFWSLVLTLVLLASLESLLSCKAVDQIDPLRRQADLNQELVGTGMGTVVSGALGGLPVATVIARSSVNVNHGGKSRASNFFHGVLLLILMVAFPHLIQEVPLAALAAILIFTGYKLASPKVFRDAYLHGPEQLGVLILTLISTLVVGLLPGICVGLVGLLLIHAYFYGDGPGKFVRQLLLGKVERRESSDGGTRVKIPEVCNFLTLGRVARSLSQVPGDSPILVDFSATRLIDSVSLEYLKEYQERQPGQLEIIGLGLSEPICDHPLALRCRRKRYHGRVAPRLSGRQRRLAEMAQHHHWVFRPELDWVDSSLHDFEYFRCRPFEFRRNRVEGNWEQGSGSWELMDVNYEEGLQLGAEEHHATVLVAELSRPIPVFTLSQTSWIDRILARAGVSPGPCLARYADFPAEYVLLGEDHAAVAEFFQPELVEFFVEEELHHVESNGHALFVFRRDRLLTAREALAMVRYTQRLVELIEG